MTQPETPAYPCVKHEQTWGLTKRERFAMAEMQGILSNYERRREAHQSNTGLSVSDFAVSYADALIEKLNRDQAG